MELNSRVMFQPYIADNISVKSLSVIIPCFNEEEVLPVFINELEQTLNGTGVLWEIIIVNDGSFDNSYKFLMSWADESSRVVIHHKVNLGHTRSLLTGILHAKNEAIMTMDADLQHPPLHIPKMLSCLEEGSEIIFMKREETEGISFIKKTLSNSFYAFLRALTGSRIIRGGDFLLISNRIKNKILSLCLYNVSLRFLLGSFGVEMKAISYKAPKRVLGESKFTFLKSLKMAINAILYNQNKIELRALVVEFYFAYSAFFGIPVEFVSSYFYIRPNLVHFILQATWSWRCNQAKLAEIEPTLYIQSRKSAA